MILHQLGAQIRLSSFNPRKSVTLLSPAEAGRQVRPRLDPVRQDRGASAGLSGQETLSVTGSPSGMRERVGNTRS